MKIGAPEGRHHPCGTLLSQTVARPRDYRANKKKAMALAITLGKPREKVVTYTS